MDHPLTDTSRVGPYRILRRLGGGGMGSVYLAHDTRLNRQVAIKFLHEVGPDTSARLQREARAAARLNHPNIAAIYDIAEHENVPFLVHEYVAGEPLSAVVARGALPVDRAIDIVVQLADALDYAHREGVIHRDIKPANIVLGPDGRPKLLDLGIARVLFNQPPAPEMDATTTSTTGWHGTLAYMAPEQLLERTADGRSDIYSAGVLLFELLTGRRPYEGPDQMGLALAITVGPTPSVTAERPDVPAEVSAVIARAMARDPKARPQTAGEFRDALIRARTDTPVVVERPRASPPRLRPAVALGTLTLAVLAILSLLMWRSAARTIPPRGPITVLPAVNLSGQREVEHVGAGLVSVLADNLAAGPGLTVVPAATAAVSRGASRNVRGAALELGARYVVDVAVASASGNQMRVRARLVDTERDTVLWADEYEADQLAVQRELSRDLIGALETNRLFARKPTDSERRRMARLPTTRAEALRAYSTGVALLETPDNRAQVLPAVAAFEEAVRHDPDFALAHAGLSRALGSMYTYTREPSWAEKAEAAARRAMEIDPDRSQVHLSMAAVYQTAGRLEDALRHARVAVELAPENDQAHRLMGNIQVDRGDDAALTSLRRAVALRPDYWLNHFDLGIACYGLGRYSDALAPLRRVTELRPEYSGGFQALGTVYHVLGDREQAIGNYEHALRLAPEATAFSNLAFAYYADGRFQQALENWRRAVELDPTSPATHRNLGDAYTRLGRQEEARAAYEEAITRASTMLAVNPRDARRIALIALCEAKLGRRHDASRHSAEAMALAPANSDVVFKAALVGALLGEPDRAMQHLRRAVDLGYPRAFAREDEDLRALRTRDDFRKLVSEP